MKFIAAISLILTSTVHYCHCVEIDYKSKAMLMSEVQAAGLSNQAWLGVLIPLGALSDQSNNSNTYPVHVLFPTMTSNQFLMGRICIYYNSQKIRCRKYNTARADTTSNTFAENAKAIFELTPIGDDKMVDLSRAGRAYEAASTQQTHQFGLLVLDPVVGLYISARSHSLTIMVKDSIINLIDLHKYCEEEVKPALTKLDLGLNVDAILNHFLTGMMGNPFLDDIDFAILGSTEFE